MSTDDRIKVRNMLNSMVRINLTKFNGKIVPIQGKGYALLTDDELAYVRNTSMAFHTGTLKVDDIEKVPEELDIPESPNAIDEKEIKALLRKTHKNIESGLAELDNIHILNQVLDIAKEQDKSVKVIGMIEARIEEVRQ